MKRTNPTPRLILAALALCAARTQAQAKPRPSEWSSALSCAIPAFPLRPLKLPVANAAGKSDPLWRLREDMVNFEDARREAYAAAASLLVAVRGNDCASINSPFKDLMEAHEQALEERKKSDLAHWPEDRVEWVNPKDAPRPGEQDASSPYYSRWDDVCKRPGPARRRRLPVVPADGTPTAKRALADLARDTEAFQRAEEDLHAAVLKMMRAEGAFRCREGLERYAQMSAGASLAYRSRKSAALAEIEEESVEWEPLP